jgi:hypothetical protein
VPIGMDELYYYKRQKKKEKKEYDLALGQSQ